MHMATLIPALPISKPASISSPGRAPNIERDGESVTYWESYWQRTGRRDSVDIPYQVPANLQLWNSALLIRKLYTLQERLNKTDRFTKHDKYTCPLCHKYVSDREYYYRNVHWNESLAHQIEVHGTIPSTFFFDFLLGSTVELRRGTVALAGRRQDSNMVVTQNQWRIMDSLMNSGGKRKWQDTNKKLRYSEYAGYLDRATESGTVNIVIGQSAEWDASDPTIIFPNGIPEVAEHEYYFHTHPPTPYPGSRVKNGILYEFPSYDDVYHFLVQQSYGTTRGSIIIAPEGVYILTRDKKSVGKTITIPEDARAQYNVLAMDLGKRSIKRFRLKKSTPTRSVFYNKVAPDHSYANKIDSFLRTWGLRMYYIARVKIGNEWIVEGGLLPG